MSEYGRKRLSPGCATATARAIRRGHRVTRRELIALLGSTAAAWPLGARAQPPERMRRIGVVTNIAENDLEARARIAAFNDRLNQLGWIEDRNLQIETRLTLGDANLTRKYAAELVALSPDVILAVGTEVTSALQHATNHGPHRLRVGPGPGRGRYRRAHVAPWRKRHGLHGCRIWPEWKMAGAAQRHCAPRQTSGSHSGRRLTGGTCSVIMSAPTLQISAS
jgi:hypothetical protein